MHTYSQTGAVGSLAQYSAYHSTVKGCARSSKSCLGALERSFSQFFLIRCSAPGREGEECPKERARRNCGSRCHIVFSTRMRSYLKNLCWFWTESRLAQPRPATWNCTGPLGSFFFFFFKNLFVSGNHLDLSRLPRREDSRQSGRDIAGTPLQYVLGLPVNVLR